MLCEGLSQSAEHSMYLCSYHCLLFFLIYFVLERLDIVYIDIQKQNVIISLFLLFIKINMTTLQGATIEKQTVSNFNIDF
jgi:hypothetical protein